ncbi:hypothetical protein CLOM_g24673, partial [Closterium sp. NIES-68]
MAVPLSATFLCLSLNLTLCHVYKASPQTCTASDTSAARTFPPWTAVAATRSGDSPPACSQRLLVRAASAISAIARDIARDRGSSSWLHVIGRAPLSWSAEWSEQQLQGSPWRATCPTPFLKT